MTSPRDTNRRLLLLLWAPLAVIVAGWIVHFARLAEGGEIGTLFSSVLLVPAVVGLMLYVRRKKEKQLAVALLAPTPAAFRELAFGNGGTIPYGLQMATANVATVTALYGDVEEADRSLRSISWDGCPPMVDAQRSVARAVIAYARGDYGGGRSHAIRAAMEADVPEGFPGASTSALAVRMHEALGRALSGTMNDESRRVLELAREKLPLLGKVLAAWGLAAIAKREENEAHLAEQVTFLRAHAPHFAPVFASLEGDETAL